MVSGQRWTAIAPRGSCLELCRYAQQQILAPERRDELDADRQPACCLPDRQADGRLAGDAERCREAPDAFEARQDRERVGGWRQELVEKGGGLAGGGREEQVEVVCPPRRHLCRVGALPGLAGGVGRVGEVRADAREWPRVRLDIVWCEGPSDRGGESVQHVLEFP